MSMLFTDGFEKYTDFTTLLTKWAAESSTGISTSIFRTGARGLIVGSFITSRALFTPAGVAASGDFVLGAAFYFPATSSGGNGFIYLAEGVSINHIFVRTTINGAIQVVNGDGTVLATSANGTILLNTWYYIEVKFKVHDTAGDYEVRVDEVPVLVGTGNHDTRNGATGVWDRFTLSGSSTVNVDDLYALDTSGTENNDFLGNSYIVHGFVSTDAVAAGTDADFACSTGSDRGALCDETISNGDTDYISSATPGDRNSFKIPSLSLSGVIRCVDVSVSWKKTDAGVRTAKITALSNGTYGDGVELSLPTTYRIDSQIFERDPDTNAAWLAAAINAPFEPGIKVET